MLQELLLIIDSYLPCKSSFFSSDKIASLICHLAELWIANVLIILIFLLCIQCEMNDRSKCVLFNILVDCKLVNFVTSNELYWGKMNSSNGCNAIIRCLRAAAQCNVNDDFALLGAHAIFGHRQKSLGRLIWNFAPLITSMTSPNLSKVIGISFLAGFTARRHISFRHFSVYACRLIL